MGATTSTTAITNIYSLIILDESGSMSSIYEQALQRFPAVTLELFMEMVMGRRDRAMQYLRLD